MVLRGNIISYQSSIKKAKSQHLVDDRAELAVLEDDYCNTKDENTLSAILKIKSEYNHILGEQVGNYICKLK